MTTVTYLIPGIHCHHCIHTIQMEVGELEGVKSVQTDLQTKRTMITFEAPATEEKIKSLLTELDYPVAA